MEQADRCRRAAFEAVADVEPSKLRDVIESTLDEASMVPGALTLESAAASRREATAGLDLDGSGSHRSEAGHGRGIDAVPTETDGIETNAAGVQLIYEGLRLTRSLAHDEPWTDADASGDGDIEILAADILVARGFYLLARTDAAGKAVRTVQGFGRDQTRGDAVSGDGHGTVADDQATLDANLERDVLELAVLTGAAAVGETPSSRLLGIADEIADAVGPSFPPAEECLAGFDATRSDRSLEDPTTDRATSATDP